MTVSNCCCCLDLRRGVVLIAAGEIILTLFAMIMMLVYMDECIEGMHTYGYVIVMIYVGLCLLSSIPLILGAIIMNRLLMLPWLLLNFLLMASAAVVALVLIVMYSGALAVICVSLIVINGLILYFFQVTYSLYLEIEYEERKANISSVKIKN